MNRFITNSYALQIEFTFNSPLNSHNQRKIEHKFKLTTCYIRFTLIDLTVLLVIESVL